MHFDVKEIVSAWVSRKHPTEDQKALATQRAEICNECDQVGEILEDRRGSRYCKKCGCLLEGKIYSYREGACPLGKWDEVDFKYQNTRALKILKNPKKII